MLDKSLHDLNDCGCCKGITLETPITIDNRPGLNTIAYRVGTHALFKQSMLARLSSFARDYPALNGLKARDDDDFSVILLDGWAMVADVLTFYQERIANESYLRTATERLSLLQLARLIGYELRPGVAANVFLAFLIEEAPGAPKRATIDIGTKVQSIPGPNELPQTFETVEKLDAQASWNRIEPERTETRYPLREDNKLFLKGAATGLKEGDGIVIIGDLTKDRNAWDFCFLKKIELDNTLNVTTVTLDRNLFYVDKGQRVYALRKRAALFGANAPDARTLAPDTVKRIDGYGGPGKDWKFVLDNPLNLDAIYPNVTASVGDEVSWLILRISEPGRKLTMLYKITGVSESAPAKYTLTNKTTQLTISDNDSNNSDLNYFAADLRSVGVFVQSEELTFADMPVTTQITGKTIPLVQPVASLFKGQRIIISNQEVFTPGNGAPLQSEAGIIDAIDGLTITLHDGLTNKYDQATAVIYGNVARATHGESVPTEVLGNGDASQPYQQFTLRQGLLTYVSAPTASGSASTLAVRINDVLWHEIPTLYGHGPHEHIYITRTSDDGKTTLEFGDGKSGARLPTGQENVVANYRKGKGIAGQVKARQLSLLMTRPLGVKSVINPTDATGAMDAETLATSRQNAPLTVLTLDRVVSLQDYEDFARAFAGITKALATWTWNGQKRCIFLTVAGTDGADVAEGTPTYINLLNALRDAGDPRVSIQVKSYQKAYFKIEATLTIDSDYEADRVKAAVEQALRDHFSFAARNFGQPVMASEVIAVMQNVPGVIAVDLEKLYRTGQQAPPNPGLTAAVPLAGADGTVSPAELLTLDPTPIESLGAML